jgi:hypothetical protein
MEGLEGLEGLEEINEGRGENDSYFDQDSNDGNSSSSMQWLIR